MSTDSQITHEQSKHIDADSDVVAEVIDGRRGVYGDPTNTFARVAVMWQAILDGKPIQAWHVPLFQMAFKMIRTAECPDYSDNSDDIEGYLAIFREIMGEDMVQARSVSEYLAIKHGVDESREENLLATIGELEAEVQVWKQRAQAAANIARQANP